MSDCPKKIPLAPNILSKFLGAIFLPFGVALLLLIPVGIRLAISRLINDGNIGNVGLDDALFKVAFILFYPAFGFFFFATGFEYIWGEEKLALLMRKFNLEKACFFLPKLILPRLHKIAALVLALGILGYIILGIVGILKFGISQL